jgi:LytS/YehU family sensor histidine kinase
MNEQDNRQTGESARRSSSSRYSPRISAARAESSEAIRESVSELRQLLTQLWWQFFDWLAIVPWRTLVVVSVLVMFIGGGLLHGEAPTIFLILTSYIIKIIATGKHRAEVVAQHATERADTEQMERSVLEARMEALQAQIEPHFLFNTLASIDQLILTDPPRASKMQQSLIRYLRSALPRMREGSRPSLGQQVDLSRAYLEIMQVRMDERLTVSVSVPDGLRSAIFPSMMLQTLVENSIKHGLEPKADGGHIDVSAEVRDGMVEVHVVDTGLGFAPKSGEGVGLANIRERLKMLYNGRAELAIMIPEHGGTKATIRVPYEVAPQ